MKTLLCLLLLLPAATLCAQRGRPVEALSRTYYHNDGTRTVTTKDGDKNEINELTYKNNVLAWKRVFQVDSKGRWRRGFVFDGKGNPKGSIEIGYDPDTDQPVEERQYDVQARLIRRLFYPGALKDPRFGNHPVAFIYNPDDQKAAPVVEQKNVQLTQPVQSNLKEFNPGVPVGRSAPAAYHSTAPAAPVPAPAAPRRSILPARKS